MNRLLARWNINFLSFVQEGRVGLGEERLWRQQVRLVGFLEQVHRAVMVIGDQTSRTTEMESIFYSPAVNTGRLFFCWLFLVDYWREDARPHGVKVLWKAKIDLSNLRHVPWKVRGPVKPNLFYELIASSSYWGKRDPCGKQYFWPSLEDIKCATNEKCCTSCIMMQIMSLKINVFISAIRSHDGKSYKPGSCCPRQ